MYFSQKSPDNDIHDTNMDSLNELISNLAGNKGTPSRNSKSKPFRKCRYCDTLTTNIFHHLKIDKHKFACTELECNFVSNTIQECKNHLFYHYC